MTPSITLSSCLQHLLETPGTPSSRSLISLEDYNYISSSPPPHLTTSPLSTTPTSQTLRRSSNSPNLQFTPLQPHPNKTTNTFWTLRRQTWQPSRCRVYLLNTRRRSISSMPPSLPSAASSSNRSDANYLCSDASGKEQKHDSKVCWIRHPPICLQAWLLTIIQGRRHSNSYSQEEEEAKLVDVRIRRSPTAMMGY